jgi:isopenicillin-N N-acyltransferase-like protein
MIAKTRAAQAAQSMLVYNLVSSEGEIIGFGSTFDDLDFMKPEGNMLVHSNHYPTERFKKGEYMTILVQILILQSNELDG